MSKNIIKNIFFETQNWNVLNAFVNSQSTITLYTLQFRSLRLVTVSERSLLMLTEVAFIWSNIQEYCEMLLELFYTHPTRGYNRHPRITTARVCGAVQLICRAVASFWSGSLRCIMKDSIFELRSFILMFESRSKCHEFSALKTKMALWEAW